MPPAEASPRLTTDLSVVESVEAVLRRILTVSIIGVGETATDGQLADQRHQHSNFEHNSIDRWASHPVERTSVK